MKVLLFSEPEIADIVRVLAALLHLGNISFKGVVISKEIFGRHSSVTGTDFLIK